MSDQSILLNTTLAYCTKCGQAEMARIVARPGGVFMERICPEQDTQSTRIAASHTWYQQRAYTPCEITEKKTAAPPAAGCPHDCGLCQWHAGELHLPVFSITNDCNLDCPICFTYNRPDTKYYKSVDDTKKIIARILEQSGGIQLINLTGGEPTLHPQLFDIITACRHEGIQRITMNTNGIRLATDRGFAKKIKEAGVQLVLSLHTLDPAKSVLIHGRDITQEKRKALETMEELGIPATILPVCIKGVNEGDVATLAAEYIFKDFVRSCTIQNMTFTGKNGSGFQPHDHITIDEVELLLAGTGVFSEKDFFPLASYHPLCYSVAYYIVLQGRCLSLTKLLERNTLIEISRDAYLLDPRRDYSREFMAGLNRLWAEGESEDLLREMKRFIQSIYPDNGQTLHAQDRQHLIEQAIKPVYIHPHMDADNFDIDRVSRCGDLVPNESGAMVPACAYNLLYRQKDERFWIDGP